MIDKFVLGLKFELAQWPQDSNVLMPPDCSLCPALRLGISGNHADMELRRNEKAID